MNLGSTMLSINYNYIIPDCIDSSLPTSARLVVSRIFRIFSLAERHPALAHAVMAPLICWSFSNSMFRYLLVDHAVPAMWRSLAAARGRVQNLSHFQFG